ncbi:MAG: hypothetical protein SGI83_06080 [Bacteroidota bacterium]|nr:hypothetical protein [Bacteroidota bacterium]
MKHIGIVILIFLSTRLWSQNFDLKIDKFKNQCTGEVGNDMVEPEMRWSLNDKKAEFYVVSIYNSNNKTTWQSFNVTSVNILDDQVNGRAYKYTVSNYKNGNAEILYVPAEKFIKLTVEGNPCSFTYYIH